MTKMLVAKTREQLIIENEELRSRLAETEEALNAIRNGEVDAIVVSGSEGEQVYSISSAETPYRTFIEEMSEGAVTLTKDGIILYCNQTFAEIVNKPVEQVLGSELNSFIAPNEKYKIEKLFTQTSEKNDIIVTSLTNSLFLRLSLSHLPAYLHGDGYVLIVTDISELKKRENELHELVSKLVRHIKALRALRIDSINETIDVEAKRKRLEIANKQLYKEITKLNKVVTEMKLKLKMAAGK